MPGSLSTALMVALALPSLAVLYLGVRNYRETNDVERATRRTSRTVFGVVVGAVVVLLVVATEFVVALGGLVSSFPDVFGAVVLGGLAIGTAGGWLEVGVVGATLAVVVVLVVVGVAQ